MERIKYRAINIEQDKDLLIMFRKDTHYISYGSQEGFEEKSYMKRMEDRIKKFPKGQLIVEDNDKPIGQVGFFIKEINGRGIGYVNLYYLISEYRGKGLGEKLINDVEEFFRGSNVTKYQLSVSPKNKKALELYTKIGMSVIQKENDKYLMKKVL